MVLAQALEAPLITADAKLTEARRLVSKSASSAGSTDQHRAGVAAISGRRDAGKWCTPVQCAGMHAATD